MFIGATLYFVYVSKTNLIVYAQVGAHAAHASSGATLRRLSENILFTLWRPAKKKNTNANPAKNIAPSQHVARWANFDQQPTAVYADDQAAGGAQRT